MSKFVLDKSARHNAWKKFEVAYTSLVKQHACFKSTESEQVSLFPSEMLSVWEKCSLDHYPVPDDCRIDLNLNHYDLGLFNKGYDVIHDAINPDLICSSLPILCQSTTLDEAIGKSDDVYKLITSFHRAVNSYLDVIFKDNLCFMPWRLHYYQLKQSSDSYSTKWHYDSEVSRNNFFAMLFLNDLPGYGTSIFDFSSSQQISNMGYLGVPIGYRTSNLENVFPGISLSPQYFESSLGSILLFCPSMCLHRGVAQDPSSNLFSTRHNLHLSCSILPSSIELPTGSRDSFLNYFYRKPLDSDLSQMPPLIK